MNSVTSSYERSNLSVAWARAFLQGMQRGVKDLSPLVVTVEGLALSEDKAIYDRLVSHVSSLQAKHPKLQLPHSVANTIFPQSLWNPECPDAAARLFERFERAWPRIKRHKQNRRGSYFRRMTAFRPLAGKKPINQLAHIIATYRSGNHRRSALQATIFDPALDHVNSQQLGFPCLHQVAFTPSGNDGLAVTGFYATQYLFDRAYGNYLGLCRLGHFMARELGRTLTRMTCVASVAQLGSPSKEELRPLANDLRRLLSQREVTAA